MKYTLFLSLIFSFSFTCASAQQDHFLYFQTEASQAFYIKLGDKVFSSTSSGYLIMPKLAEGNYKFTVGFAKNEWPEEVINYTLEKDAGFMLKNLADKGWSLIDLQSSNILASAERMEKDTTTGKQIANEEFRKDNFSEMLATVVHDSTIKQKAVIEKTETSRALTEKPGKDIEPVTGTSYVPKADAPAAALYTIITKNLSVRKSDGIEMIYTDENNHDRDTIRIFMPVESGKPENENVEAEIKTNHQADTANNARGQLIAPQTGIGEPKNESSTGAADTAKNIRKDDKIEFLPPKSGMINSNCRQYATEDDFLKLRKKMAAGSSDDDMISAAKKSFKSKCFTTKYIKNLSSLFLNDQGKYGFFDAAYPYVSDSDIFYTLEKQLSDEYYIKRFEAMINH